MIRSALLLLFTILLVSCVPSVDKSNPYAATRYAEEVSVGVFRLPDGYSGSNKSRYALQKRTIVPVSAGETVLVEDVATWRGKVLLTSSRPIKSSSLNTVDLTDQYMNTAELAELESWSAKLELHEAAVDFSKPANRGDYYLLISGDSAGKYELAGNSTSTLTTIVRLSVPKDAKPGRYILETTFAKKENEERFIRTGFIVEVS